MPGNTEWSLSENLIITTYLNEYRSRIRNDDPIGHSAEVIAKKLFDFYPDTFENRTVETLAAHITYWDKLTAGDLTNVPEKDKDFIGTIPNLLWERSRS